MLRIAVSDVLRNLCQSSARRDASIIFPTKSHSLRDLMVSHQVFFGKMACLEVKLSGQAHELFPLEAQSSAFQ